MKEKFLKENSLIAEKDGGHLSIADIESYSQMASSIGISLSKMNTTSIDTTYSQKWNKLNTQKRLSSSRWLLRLSCKFYSETLVNFVYLFSMVYSYKSIGASWFALCKIRILYLGDEHNMDFMKQRF